MVNEDIIATIDWFTSNRLFLNPEKTQVIVLGTLRYVKIIDLTTLPEIIMDDHTIQFSTSVKYLGVTIMNSLSWEKQVTTVSNKIYSVLYQLKLCKKLLPEALRIKLVASLIYLHVDYCCAAYTDMTAEHNLKLHRTINSCIRFIFNVKMNEHITPYYKKLRWLKIMPTIQDAPNWTSFLCSNFNHRVLESDQASRFSEDTLIQSQCRTELFKRSFRITFVRLWNDLPFFVKNAKTITKFKEELYAHLLVLSS
ncbi:hypothetical protein ACFW04_001332 [Cataglyphis niger]